MSHVIPQSVGGRLAKRLECAGCNNRIGPQFESKLKLDPSVRLAVEELAETLPELAAKMRKLAPFVGSDGHVSVNGRWAGADFAVRDTPQPDGSIVKGDEATEQDLRRRFGRAGAGAVEIDAAIDRWVSAPIGVRLDLGREVSIRKGQVSGFRPDLRGCRAAPPECALAIAYRFLACLIPDVIYDGAFDGVRRALRGEPDTAGWTVEDGLLNRACAPLHGLGILRVDPHVIVRLCLFDQIVWDVSFAVRLRKPPTPHKYVLSLEDGAEDAF